MLLPMPMAPRKILILRFSSIGDIVLTSPVIRSLKLARPDTEIHFATKAAFADVVRHNPYLSRLHLLGDSWSEFIHALRAEQFDLILDLHNNLRTWRCALALGVRSVRFDKQNFAKYRMVRRKSQPASWLPHVVERYGATLAPLGLTLDGGGLDFFYPPSLNSWAEAELNPLISRGGKPLAVVLGAQLATKRWPVEHWLEALNKLSRPVLLLGGRDATTERDYLTSRLLVPHFDAVGHYSLPESVALLNQCQEVLTHDTGLMHIAAALGKKVFSIWGSTVPALGMTPYGCPSVIIEHPTLDCRPCSKIGFDSCPRGHFRCMREITPETVAGKIMEVGNGEEDLAEDNR